MTIDALIMFLGACIALLPFLGLPNSWDTVLLLLAGVAIVSLGISVRYRLQSVPKEGVRDMYKESSAESA